MAEEDPEILEPQPRPSPEAKGRAADNVGAEADEARGLEHLRALLFAGERERIQQLEQEVASKTIDARAVSEVLPEAILLSDVGDRRLSSALAPTFEESFQESVKKNPRTLASVIYPVIGPAIRQSIRNSLVSMLEGFNQALDHSLSPRGLRWRIEGWRTGRPFSEVVLLHSLVYRVEQLFLIHGTSGVLLNHVAVPAVGAQDPDLVSGMLSAIRDFVTDSFGEDGEGGLRQVEFQDKTLLLVQGPEAVLAAVVRGVPPSALRERLQAVLEDVHSSKAKALAEFEGDVETFRAVTPTLEDCLVEQRREKASGKQRSLGLGTVILGVAAAVLVSLWVRGVFEERRFESVLVQASDTPGVLITSVTESGGARVVAGLLDPLAPDPARLFADAGFDADEVTFRWESFGSLDAGLAVDRLAAALRPPAGVRLDLEGGVLRLRGRAPHRWIREASVLARAFPAVQSLDTSELVDVDWEGLAATARALEAVTVPFAPGAVTLNDEAWRVLDVAGLVRALDAAAVQAGALVEVDIMSDPSSPPSTRGARTAWVLERFQALLTSRIVAREVAPEPGAEPRAKLSERVLFRVTPIGADQ